jgi:uncharacterized protein YlzI (FlbEa/FlbD family)
MSLFIKVHMTDVPEGDVCLLNPDHINAIHQTPGGSQPNPQFDVTLKESMDEETWAQYCSAVPLHLVTEPGTYIGLTNGRTVRVTETADEVNQLCMSYYLREPE